MWKQGGIVEEYTESERVQIGDTEDAEEEEEEEDGAAVHISRFF